MTCNYCKTIIAYLETVFKIIYELANDGDLVGYISDDFGLIVDSRILKYSNAWLDKLICSYKNVKKTSRYDNFNW